MQRAFTSKALDGSDALHRRATYQGCGFDPADMNKPVIGIANTFTDASPGHAHLRPLVDAIKSGVWAAGGIPMEFGVPATCGNIAIGTQMLRYELPIRDVVAASVELVSKIQLFDGLVVTASCDNIVPGVILGAARVDIPTVVFTGGPMLAGSYGGKPLVLSDANELVFGRSAQGTADPAYASSLAENCCPTCGACPVLGTANTMQLLSEALGLTLPGAAAIPAILTKKTISARHTGRRVVEMVFEGGMRFSDIVTREAIENAIMVYLAIGGSTNAVMHLISLGKELDIPITLEDFERLNPKTPYITNIRPGGTHTVDELDAAGGLPALMKQLEPLLHTQVRTVSGKTVGENLQTVCAEPNDIIRSIQNPLSPQGGVVIMRGNLAPGGAIVRTTSITKEMMFFRGRARVFNSDEAAFAALIRKEVVAGDVIVIRYAGPVGAPGMVEVMLTADALVDLGLDKSIALITDGRFSGFNYGPIVGHVTPEAALGGPLALVEEGDSITLDIPNKELSLHVEPAVLEERLRRLPPFASDIRKGFLRTYSKNCLSASEGAAMQAW